MKLTYPDHPVIFQRKNLKKMVSKLFLLSITKKNIRIEIIENLPPVSNKVIIQGMEIGPTKNIKKKC